jgi:hypothetical protein
MREQGMAPGTRRSRSGQAAGSGTSWSDLTAVAYDRAHGRLSSAPSDEETAAQIARFAGHDVAEILAAWTDSAAQLEHTRHVHPVGIPQSATFTCHQHDIRGAIGRPEARNS